MPSRNKIDAKALLREAVSSGSKEAFVVLVRGDGHRIGVGARVRSSGRPSHFVEAVIDLSMSTPKVDLPLMERKLAVLRQLETRGYSLSCQDDLDVFCEADVPAQSFEEECRKVESIFSWILSDWRLSTQSRSVGPKR